jgi:hypothetical protein
MVMRGAAGEDMPIAGVVKCARPNETTAFPATFCYSENLILFLAFSQVFTAYSNSQVGLETTLGRTRNLILCLRNFTK